MQTILSAVEFLIREGSTLKFHLFTLITEYVASEPSLMRDSL